MILLALACGDPEAPSAASADAGPDRVVPVWQFLELEGKGEGVRATWDFGDGTQDSGFTVSHQWSDPGTYTVVLQVEGEDGSRRTDSTKVVVHRPLLDTPPLWTATVAVSEEGVWTVHRDLGLSVVRPDGSVEQLLALRGAEALHLQTDAVIVQGRYQRWSVDRDSLAITELAPPDERLEDPGGWASWDGHVARTKLRSDTEGGRVTLDGDEVFLTADTRPDSDTMSGGIPNLLQQVVPSPDGTRVFVPASQANVLRGEYLDGTSLRFDTSIRGMVQVLDIDKPDGGVGSRKLLDERGRVSAVAVSPWGERLYLLDPGVGAVTALDAWTLDIVGSILGIGPGATGLAVSADGLTLYVNSPLDRVLIAFDVSDLSRPAQVGEWRLDPEGDPVDPTVLAGERVFWNAADPRATRSGYIACAHCHPGGRDDGQTWDFTQRGEGLRNTPSLEGRAGMGMGPVHWSANFDEIQDFENDMRNHFGGSGYLSEADWAECSDPLGASKAGRSEDLDALAAYLESLTPEMMPPSPYPPGDATIFAAQGCEGCHPPPLYTDSSLETFVRHDVGTLGPQSGGRLGGTLDGLDTPTLLGAWDTAPYLHDGSAPTVEAAIATHAGYATLDTETLEALGDFVRGL